MASSVLPLRSLVSSSLPLRGKPSANRRKSRLSISFPPERSVVKLAVEDFKKWEVESRSKLARLLLSGAIALGVSLSGLDYVEAKVGVNKPELLPKEYTPVIDVAGFLSDGQENRLIQEVTDLEKDTGYKLRILIQNFPDTPDPTFGNILHFNVGASVDLEVPRSFWPRVAGKYGNVFYWKEKGEDRSIEDAVGAISTCLRDPLGSNSCSAVL